MTRGDTGYSPGHPWFYVRGGRVPKPSEIIADVRLSGYRGYRESDIEAADGKCEPARSAELRAIKADVLKALRSDLARYRAVARDLHAHRRGDRPAEGPQLWCGDVHTNVSLKYCHLYNGFAHLLRLEELLSRQGDLFDF